MGSQKGHLNSQLANSLVAHMQCPILHKTPRHRDQVVQESHMQYPAKDSHSYGLDSHSMHLTSPNVTKKICFHILLYYIKKAFNLTNTCREHEK